MEASVHIVTGSSAGIGAATVQRLTARGARVVINCGLHLGGAPLRAR